MNEVIPKLIESQTLEPSARQQQYLQELGSIPESYTQWLETLPEEKQRRVRGRVSRIKHGLHAVAPLQCTGPGGCPFIAACPLVELVDGKIDTGPPEQYPYGQSCLLEAEFMIQRQGEYLIHLDVDPLNPIEMSVVQELALIDLQKNRALLVTAHGDREGNGRDLMHVDISVTGYDDSDRPLESRTTKIHPALEYIDKLERRREKWLDRLMETRKAKADWAAKMGQKQGDSALLNELQAMREAIQHMTAEPVELLVDDTPIGLDDD